MAAGQVTETKTIQVRNDPEEIDRVTRKYGLFFWSVQGTQITDTKNTTYSVVGDTIFRETEHTNYATITLTRDKLMPRYEEVTELEKLLEQKEAMKGEMLSVPTIRFHIISRASLIFSILIAIPAILDKRIFLGIIILLAGGGIWYFSKKRGTNNKNLINELDEALKASPTINEILQQAQALNTEILREMRA